MKLHDYQEVALHWLRTHDKAGLFLDMGLGKTATSLTALEPRHLPVLVVAPKRVAESVWPTERNIWRPDLSIAVAKGSPAQRRNAYAQQADITVIGRDNLKDPELLTQQYQTIIIDELSGFKTRSSQRWRAARKLCATAPHVWGLTGTPSPNGLIDLWAQIFLLDGGRRLGGTLTKYRSRFFTPGRQLPNGIITEWVLKPEADTRIHELLEDLVLSMGTEGRVQLPPVTVNDVEVTLPPSVASMYKKFKRDLVLDLEVIGGELHTAQNAAVLSGKLSQISAGVLYSDDADLNGGQYDLVHSEKLKAVQEVVEGTGSPVLVFYRFRAEKEQLQKALGGLAHTIDEPDIVERWNAGQIPVLLAHPASAGHGLNLQHGGHTVVWTSLPWSLEEWQQANKRVARQGQKNPVVIHLILARRTIDGAIKTRLTEKTSVQQALLTHLESPI